VQKLSFKFLYLKEKYSGQNSLPIYWLAFSSVVFYTIWNPSFTPILLSSITVNGVLAYALIKKNFSQTQRKWIRNIGVLGNLLFLGYFKYFSFLLENANSIIGTNFTLDHIILPLGISFYTFQKIALLIDAEKGKVEDFQLNKYLLFVTFFPQLIAGPLVHHKDLMPQIGLDKLKTLSIDNVTIGLCIFVIGLFKKTVIADTMSPIADMVFNTVSEGTMISAYAAWVGAISYTIQLYFDFSGYSDMAIGLAMMFGIQLPQNFNSPYKSASIIDFWRRWHMTLSSFLRDYVYIPLGGNKSGEKRRYINLFLVMLIGGLWHGAGWTFVL
jgi:D-alanyl-lipoteichoic acid acyltransferase DltB (MBOAT superfamily)